MRKFQAKDLLGIESLAVSDIEFILETARSLQEVSRREVKKVPVLRGKTVVNLFFESSTRTRTSFEIAAKRLSADVINISKTGSSIEKGESLLDTARTLHAMGPDIIVCRHASAGVPHWLAKNLDASVINAGDGAHEHPTQALLDVMTIQDVCGKIAGLNVAIVGDIEHSRVARSDIHALKKLGAKVAVVGPATMISRDVEALGVSVYHELVPGIRNADVIIMLRIQRERLGVIPFPSLREYARLYGLNAKVLRGAKEGVVILHPGPVNRGIEIDPEEAASASSYLLDQVTNGVAIRMAVLYLIATGKEQGVQK